MKDKTLLDEFKEVAFLIGAAVLLVWGIGFVGSLGSSDKPMTVHEYCESVTDTTNNINSYLRCLKNKTKK